MLRRRQWHMHTQGTYLRLSPSQQNSAAATKKPNRNRKGETAATSGVEGRPAPSLRLWCPAFNGVSVPAGWTIAARVKHTKMHKLGQLYVRLCWVCSLIVQCVFVGNPNSCSHFFSRVFIDDGLSAAVCGNSPPTAQYALEKAADTKKGRRSRALSSSSAVDNRTFEAPVQKFMIR